MRGAESAIADPYSPLATSGCITIASVIVGRIVTLTRDVSDSVVWYFTGGRLMGVDGETGASIFRGVDSLGYIDKFQTPIVAKGRLYIAASDAVHAFTLR